MSQPGPSVDKVRAVRSQVNDVVDIMQSNISSVVERGEKLEDLEQRTDVLQNDANNFRKTTQKVRRNMWWKNFKLNIILGVIVVVVLLIIIVPIAVTFSNKN